MNLVSLRVWHWMLVGLVLGSIVGYVYVGPPLTTARSANASTFKDAVRTSAERAAAGKTPRLRNVTVYPPESDPSGLMVYPVRFDMLTLDAQGNASYQVQNLDASTPYEGKDSIIDFLTKNKVSYADRIGNGKYLPVAYGAAAGFAVIGLCWPMIVSLMVSAGIVEARVVEPKPKRAASAGSHEDKSLVKPGARGVTGADRRDLDALNDEMEHRIGKGLKAGGRAASATAEEPVSVLMSGSGSRSTSDPTEAPVAVQTEGRPKDYKGEWYPVARPAVKKGDHA